MSSESVDRAATHALTPVEIEQSNKEKDLSLTDAPAGHATDFKVLMLEEAVGWASLGRDFTGLCRGSTLTFAGLEWEDSMGRKGGSVGLRDGQNGRKEQIDRKGTGERSEDVQSARRAN